MVEGKSIRSRDTKASRCSKRASAEVWGLVEMTEIKKKSWKEKKKARKKKKSKAIKYAIHDVQNHYIKLNLGIGINMNATVTFLASSAFSLCSVLPLTFRRTSSISGRFPGPFFFFSLAKIDDSLSGNGGISSKTVACRQVLLEMNQPGKCRQML